MGQREEVPNAYDKFWKAYAEAFAQSVQANGLLGRFVTNPDVTGAYAEAWVRLMTKNMLSHRFRISTGAVIRPEDANRGLRDIPQCDLIVWDPSELPAIFEYGEFALVPFYAARAIIEIKRSGDRSELTDQLKKQRKLLTARGPVLGVIVDHPQPLFDQAECSADWLRDFRYGTRRAPTPNGRDKERLTMYDEAKDPPMTRLLHGNSPDTNGIMAFIFFLGQVAGHTNKMAYLRERPRS